MNTVNLMEKNAFKPVLPATLAGAVINPLTWDYMMNDNPDAKFGVTTIKDMFTGNMDRRRAVSAALNALLGAGGGYSVGAGFTKAPGALKLDSDAVGKGIMHGAGAIAMSPAKDLLVNLIPLTGKASNTMDEVNDTSKKALEEVKKNSKTMKWLAGAGIAGALGLGGLGIAKYLASKNKEDKARIKYKLKGKEGDPSTGAVIEMPIDSPEFSNKLMEGLNMGIKRQVGKTIRYNSLKIDPATGKKIPYEEYMKRYNEDGTPRGSYDMPKEASTMSSLLTGAAGGALGAAAGVSLPGDMNPLLKALLGGGVGVGVGSLAALASKNAENGSHWETDEQTAMRNAVNNVSFANTGSSAVGFAGDITAPGSPSDVADTEDALDDDLDKEATAGPPPQGPQGPPPPPPPPMVNGFPGRAVDPLQNVAVVDDHVTSGGKPKGYKAKLNSAEASLQAVNDRNIVKPASCNLRDIFDVEFYPFGTMEKAASALTDVRDIMDRIYNENPSFWPYGLNVEGHNGGVYLIRDKMTKQAAGFVGWQSLPRNGMLVGSYSIGILPEYRHKGFAKEAVAKILSKKAATVDKVVAYIKEDNYKSKALANSLGVPIVEKF